MKSLIMRLSLLVFFLGTSFVQAQWLSLPTPDIPRLDDGSADLDAAAPRLPNGRPDISGLWAAVGVSGDIPDSDKYLPWVRERMVAHAENFYALQPRYNCLPSGPSYLTAGTTSTGLRRFIQSENIIAVLHEDLVHRTIYLDGRELEQDPLPSWMGYSVGRWEGDTLVVDSNGYNDKTWLDRRGIMHTEQLTITEHYTRTSFGEIELDVAYRDPGAFSQPLEARITLRYQPDNELLEYVCNESDQLGSNWEGSLAQAEETAQAVDLDILENYVGTYEGFWLGNRITLEFVIEDGKLHLLRNGVDVRLIPQSETTFDGSNGFGFVFSVDESGRAVSVEEVHVSGGWPFPRTD